MDLGHVYDLTAVVTLIAGVGGLIAGLVRAGAWLNNWASGNRIGVSLERKKVALVVAQELDDIGEHSWATEVHKRAWMEVMLTLARLEVNRSRPVRFVVAYIGWLLYFATIGLELASRNHPWMGVAGVVTLFVSMGIAIWFLITMRGFERAITERAKKKYERHERDGRIGSAGNTAHG